jgi:chaperone modulatory protein CbpM
MTEIIWLNEAALCSFEHLADVSGLSIEELGELVDSGVLQPADRTAQPPLFRLGSLVMVNSARRLRDDFELDRNGLTLALRLLQRIAELERQVQALQAPQTSWRG